MQISALFRKATCLVYLSRRRREAQGQGQVYLAIPARCSHQADHCLARLVSAAAGQEPARLRFRQQQRRAPQELGECRFKRGRSLPAHQVPWHRPRPPVFSSLFVHTHQDRAHYLPHMSQHMKTCPLATRVATLLLCSINRTAQVCNEMQLALSTQQREARCRGRQHSLRTAERFYSRKVSLANSAEMALEVGQGLAATILQSTKAAREALLAEAASLAARPAALNLALEVEAWEARSSLHI